MSNLKIRGVYLPIMQRAWQFQYLLLYPLDIFLKVYGVPVSLIDKNKT